MNCIAATRNAGKARLRRVAASVQALAASLLFACAAAAQAPPERIYDAVFTVSPDPGNGTAAVELSIGQSRHFLREMSMQMPSSRFDDLRGDGEVEIEDDRVTWLVPAAGGKLQWTVKLRHRRDEDSYDAWLGDDWGLFRATDLIPPARTRTLKNARSRTELRFDLPSGWSSLTEYFGRDNRYRVRNAERRYDRPAGWILLGDMGVRIEKIAGIQVVIGGPTGQNVRRLDMLAFLHWTLPQLTRVLPDFPERLTVVSAADSMWYGGLSGPRSFYVHADLPLISENATSAILHELMHIGSGLSARDEADWIVEGLAEYYALEILRRSRGISAKRYADAIASQDEWGRDVADLCSRASSGAHTARAVSLFARLASELDAASSASNPLDDLLRNLVAEDGKVSLKQLRRIATDIHGSLPAALSANSLPGCDAQGDR